MLQVPPPNQPSPLPSGAAQSTYSEYQELARSAARKDWVNRYTMESARLADGRIDHESAFIQGHALHQVVGHRLPEEVARQMFNSFTGADNTLVSADHKFQALAAGIGLIHQGEALSQDLLSFAHGVAELCAAVGDRFRDAREGSAGDLIRANYGPAPF